MENLGFMAMQEVFICKVLHLATGEHPFCGCQGLPMHMQEASVQGLCEVGSSATAQPDLKICQSAGKFGFEGQQNLIMDRPTFSLSLLTYEAGGQSLRVAGL